MADNKISKIRAEIEKRYNENIARKTGLANIRANECLGILHFIDSMQEEPISEDFEEEFERAWLDYLETKPFRYSYDKDRLKEIAHRFANWQKQKMMKNAVSGHIGQTVNGILRVLSDEVDDELGFEAGDKVKVIIIKEADL